MEYNEFKKIFLDETNKINIVLANNQILKFYIYMNELIEWNKVMNLTAIIEPKEIIRKHFVDCLVVNKYIKEGCKLIDVGTGAGFPGIPLKIFNNDIQIDLLDSLNKRINFLNNIVKKIELKGVKTFHGRAENFVDGNNRETYDIAISRAVAELPVLLEYMLPFVKVGGLCICMKGLKFNEELEKSKNVINLLGGEIFKIEKFSLYDDMTRNVIIIRKIKETPMKFPRKNGKILKNPLV